MMRKTFNPKASAGAAVSTNEPDIEESARATVAALLTALQGEDVEGYRSLLSNSDQEYMPLEVLRDNMAAMKEQAGKLLSFEIEGIVPNPAAGHAAVHVRLNFENMPPKTELYHVTNDDGEWRLHFDFEELLGPSS